MTLPQVLMTRHVQGLYLLLDRRNHEIFRHSIIHDYVPEAAMSDIDAAFFARSREKTSPVLIELAACPDMDADERAEWLQASFDNINNSIRYGGHCMLSAWLYSDAPRATVVSHLQSLFAQRHSSGLTHHLHYQDPRITWLLDQFLPDAEKDHLLGPIQHWWYAMFPGQLKQISRSNAPSSTGMLHIPDTCWQRLDAAGPYYQLLQNLRVLNELYPELLLLTAMPDFETVYRAFQDACAQPWVNKEADMIGEAMRCLLLGPDSAERYPDVAALLQKFRSHGIQTLDYWLIFAGAAFWQKPLRPLPVSGQEIRR